MKKKVQTVKAELWRVSICNGALDMVHGNYRRIHEFYIPDYNLSFNIENDTLNVFKSDSYRYDYKGNEYNSDKPLKLEETKLSKDFVVSLSKLVSLKAELYKEAVLAITDLSK